MKLSQTWTDSPKSTTENPYKWRGTTVVLSQVEGKKVELEQDAMVNEVAVTGSKGKVMPPTVFGNGATLNNCSFVLHMWNEKEQRVSKVKLTKVT